jgi:hypothetical protein
MTVGSRKGVARAAGAGTGLALAAALAACASVLGADFDRPAAEEGGVSCITEGASYLLTFKQASGSCPVDQTPGMQLVNVNADGSIAGEMSIVCAAHTQNGCEFQGTNCMWTAGGYSLTGNSEVTFTADGSSASGVEVVTVSGNGEMCSATYDVTFVRQSPAGGDP